MNPLARFQNNAEAVVSKADKGAEQVKEIKTGREEQKKKIGALEKQILGIDKTIRSDTPTLTKTQKEILTRSKEAATELMAEKKSVRSEIRLFGQEINKSNIEGLRGKIQDSSDKIDRLVSGDRHFYQKSLSESERKDKSFATLLKMEGRATEINIKNTTLSYKQGDLALKIAGIEKKLNQLQIAGKSRLDEAAKVRFQYEGGKEALDIFKKSAEKMSTKSIPQFENQLKNLSGKMEELKKLEDKLGSTAINPNRKEEQAFLKENVAKREALSNELRGIKEDIQKTLEGGTRKLSLGERIKHAISTITYFKTTPKTQEEPTPLRPTPKTPYVPSTTLSPAEEKLMNFLNADTHVKEPSPPIQEPAPKEEIHVKEPSQPIQTSAPKVFTENEIKIATRRLMPDLRTTYDDTLSPQTKISMVQNRPEDYDSYVSSLPPKIQDKFRAIEKIQSENPDLFRAVYRDIMDSSP